MDRALAELVRLVDDLEERAIGYLTLDEVAAAASPAAADRISAAVAENVLLVDHRTRVDPPTYAPTPVTLCRLNRRHPFVRALALDGWGPGPTGGQQRGGDD